MISLAVMVGFGLLAFAVSRVVLKLATCGASVCKPSRAANKGPEPRRRYQ